MSCSVDGDSTCLQGINGFMAGVQVGWRPRTQPHFFVCDEGGSKGDEDRHGRTRGEHGRKG